MTDEKQTKETNYHSVSASISRPFTTYRPQRQKSIKLDDVKDALRNKPKTLENLENILFPLLVKAIPSLSFDGTVEWKEVRELSRHFATEIRRSNPHFPEVPKKDEWDVTAGADWCTSCRFEESKTTGPIDNAVPRIQPKHKRAQQAYNETLELAEKNGHTLDADRMQVWKYGKDHLEGYDFPTFKTFGNYLNGYVREAEAKKKYLEAGVKTI